MPLTAVWRLLKQSTAAWTWTASWVSARSASTRCSMRTQTSWMMATTTSTVTRTGTPSTSVTRFATTTPHTSVTTRATSTTATPATWTTSTTTVSQVWASSPRAAATWQSSTPGCPHCCRSVGQTSSAQRACCPWQAPTTSTSSRESTCCCSSAAVRMGPGGRGALTRRVSTRLCSLGRTWTVRSWRRRSRRALRVHEPVRRRRARGRVRACARVLWLLGCNRLWWQRQHWVGTGVGGSPAHGGMRQAGCRKLKDFYELNRSCA
mmetsp:Transcript_35574/g.105141  ORF Transcript_35574/g.105141 Transcript_35574/m.105141 type:complete len:264 (-) Transcript_35574:64-855(-)